MDAEDKVARLGGPGLPPGTRNLAECDREQRFYGAEPRCKFQLFFFLFPLAFLGRACAGRLPVEKKLCIMSSGTELGP